ncbi:hypothetical protein D3C80_1097190 [compost metagenome]
MFELMKCRQNVRNTFGPMITTAAMSITCITDNVVADHSIGAPIRCATPFAAWKPRNTYHAPQCISASGA